MFLFDFNFLTNIFTKIDPIIALALARLASEKMHMIGKFISNENETVIEFYVDLKRSNSY